MLWNAIVIVKLKLNWNNWFKILKAIIVWISFQLILIFLHVNKALTISKLFFLIARCNGA